MKSLKQTLQREAPKKNRKNITAASGLHKGKQSDWTELHSLIECQKSPSKFSLQAVDLQLQEEIISMIEQADVVDSTGNFESLVSEILEKMQSGQSEGKQSRTAWSKGDEQYGLLKSLVRRAISSKKCLRNKKSSNSLVKFEENLCNLIQKKERMIKKQRIQQFDEVVRMLSPKYFGNKVEARQKAARFNSPKMKVRVTREEIEFRPKSLSGIESEQGLARKKAASTSKDEEKKSKISLTRSEDGLDRLKKLMNRSGDGSLKIIKTKVQYDYSAILEASRSKVRCRKANQTEDTSRKEDTMTSKLNKVRKNDAFAFFRPEPKPSAVGVHKKEARKGKNKGMSLHGYILDQ